VRREQSREKTSEEIEEIAELVVDAVFKGRHQAHGQRVISEFVDFLRTLGVLAVKRLPSRSWRLRGEIFFAPAASSTCDLSNT
jgi:hypothetical protein